MNWQRKVTKSGFVDPMGLICPPYFLGKYAVNGHLEYRLWFNNDLIAEKGTFEECQEAAKQHAGMREVMEGRA